MRIQGEYIVLICFEKIEFVCFKILSEIENSKQTISYNQCKLFFPIEKFGIHTSKIHFLYLFKMYILNLTYKILNFTMLFLNFNKFNIFIKFFFNMINNSSLILTLSSLI